MSLVVTLSASKILTLTQPVTGYVDTTAIIDFVTDRPALSTVSAFVKGAGLITLPDLSYNNYNNPIWTDDLVKISVQNYLYNFN